MPAFLDGVDAQVDGGLTSEERACLARGYQALGPQVVDAAVADALGGSKGVKAAARIEAMVRGCGVRIGG